MLTSAEAALFRTEVQKAFAAAPTGDDETSRARRWATAVDLGLPGLLVPEELGGSGGGPAELAVVAEAAGAVLLDAPLLAVAACAMPALVAGCPDEPMVGELLDRGARVGVVLPGPGTDGEEAVPLSLTTDGALTCPGPVRVLGAEHAEVWLVAGADALLAVDPATLDRRPLRVVDPTLPLTEAVLAGAPARVLATGAAAVAARRAGSAAARVWLAGASIGAARHGLAGTLAYVADRSTFGRAVGSYQSVKHRLADRWIDIESAAVLLRGALADPGRPALLDLAVAEALDAATGTARDAVLLHGAIGFTQEHEAHRYVRRARASAALLGDADRHRDRAADLLLGAVAG